jgi:hypothetical protein
MPKLNFFRQRRVDGGTRSGISVDDLIVLEAFEPGGADSDPALLWYMDVRCEGARLPAQPAAARQWFLDQRGLITGALRELAEDVRAGIDVDAWPPQRRVSPAPKGVEMTIVCSAVRRVAALELAAVLLESATHWEDHLRKLGEVSLARR